MSQTVKFKVSIQDLKDALHCANLLMPSDWQTELIEIAMLPSVKEALEKLNYNFNLERVPSKFGFGYVLKGWNSIREDYYSNHPANVANGLRRSCYGMMDIEQLRMIALGCGDSTQLKYFEVV
jgi:hypothetical protein